MRIRIDLDPETRDWLMAEAIAELRSLPDHALIIVRQGLGLPARLSDGGGTGGVGREVSDIRSEPEANR